MVLIFGLWEVKNGWQVERSYRYFVGFEFQGLCLVLMEMIFLLFFICDLGSGFGFAMLLD